MQPGGRILVIESMLYPRGGQEGEFFNRQTFIGLHGGYRTEHEHTELFRKAGLVVTQVISTSSGYDIIEGREA